MTTLIKNLKTRYLVLFSFLFSGVLPILFIRHQTQLTAGVEQMQGGIVVVSAIFLGILTWSVAGVGLYKVVKYIQHVLHTTLITSRLPSALVGAILVIAASSYNVYLISSSHEQEYVLTAAADESTDPNELSSFVGYKTNFGYRVDNLLAANPSTPTATIEALYNKKNQVGTHLSMASNPSTPDWILLKLADYHDRKYLKVMIEKLNQNPKVQNGELQLINQ